MSELTFDHEQLDVYRLSIAYVAFSYKIPKSVGGANRQEQDQWLRAAQTIPLNIAEGNGKTSLKDKNRFFKIAQGSALECASIHDILRVCDAIDDDSNCVGKTDLKRIVSMLTRLIQRTHGVSEERIEYEYRPDESGLRTSTIPPSKPDEIGEGLSARMNLLTPPRSAGPHRAVQRRAASRAHKVVTLNSPWTASCALASPTPGPSHSAGNGLGPVPVTCASSSCDDVRDGSHKGSRDA